MSDNKYTCALNNADVLFSGDTEAPNLFMVTGRVSGDDDDSASLIRARDAQEAAARFITALKEEAMASGDYEDEEPEIFVCTNSQVGHFED